jgi:pre-mRNA 3'-end-processing factor FIP1
MTATLISLPSTRKAPLQTLRKLSHIPLRRSLLTKVTRPARSFRGIKPEAPARTASVDTVPTQQNQQTPALKTESSTAQNKKLVSLKDGSTYPEVRTSSIDINATPSWDPAGKLITEVDIDADLAEHTKPWRLPGTDQTDFFNYGFDEFTWTQYCLRQQNMASTINNQKAETKQFEMMLTGGGMPGQAAPAGPQAAPPGGPMGMGMPGMGMPGMPDMNPENMAAFASVLQSQGIDPSQLDFNTFMQHYQQASMGGGQGGYGGQSMQPQQQNQGYGGQQQQSFQQQGGPGFRGGTPQPGQQGQQAQGQGFDGYSQQQIAMMQSQGGIPSGPSGGGRGRGRGRRWQ